MHLFLHILLAKVAMLTLFKANCGTGQAKITLGFLLAICKALLAHKDHRVNVVNEEYKVSRVFKVLLVRRAILASKALKVILASEALKVFKDPKATLGKQAPKGYKANVVSKAKKGTQAKLLSTLTLRQSNLSF